MEKTILINNLNKLHTTKMGKDRIIRNLKLDNCDIISHCKEKIINPKSKIKRKGKNWYCKIDDIIITINLYSYTIITVHFTK